MDARTEKISSRGWRQVELEETEESSCPNYGALYLYLGLGPLPAANRLSYSRRGRTLLRVILYIFAGAILLCVYLSANKLSVGQLLENYRGQWPAVPAVHSDQFNHLNPLNHLDQLESSEEQQEREGVKFKRSTESESDLSKRAAGIISIADISGCPSIEASAETTNTTGPNGSLFFLTCGISDKKKNSKWSPPAIKISDLIVWSGANGSWTDNHGLFAPCAPYLEIFRTEANRIGVPAILLAAFAMQESSCDPGATGAGGTAGLLQLSPEKCHDKNCYDPAVNLNIGASYLKALLDNNDNIVQAVGMWNGWYDGMTYAAATEARLGSCYTQQNLDYLHQYFNGWLQGINPYTTRMGYYFNLDICQYIQNGYPTFETSPARRRTNDPRAVVISPMGALVSALALVYLLPAIHLTPIAAVGAVAGALGGVPAAVASGYQEFMEYYERFVNLYNAAAALPLPFLSSLPALPALPALPRVLNPQNPPNPPTLDSLPALATMMAIPGLPAFAGRRKLKKPAPGMFGRLRRRFST